MRLELGKPISVAEASSLENEGEMLFALACLEKGCEVYYEIPVGCSKIDFFVVNPHAFTAGKLVEVTMEKKEDLNKLIIEIERDNKKVEVANTTGFRKNRQIENMKQSGHKWTILFDSEVKNLREDKKRPR